MTEFLWRTVFGYSNFLQHRCQFNEEFSQNLLAKLLIVGTSILHTMSPEGETRIFHPSPQLTETTKAFMASYNEFVHGEWHEIVTAGFPEPLKLTKIEIALAIRIERLSETIFSIYQKQEV